MRNACNQLIVSTNINCRIFFMNINLRILYLLLSLCFLNTAAMAQSPSSTQDSNNSSSTTTSTTKVSEIEEVKRQLREQQKEIEQLRLMLSEQSKNLEKLQNHSAQINQNSTVAPQNTSSSVTAQTDTTETRLSKLEVQSQKTTEGITRNQLGTLGFSGDLRMQYDSLYGLLNNATNVSDSSINGNELSSRQRIRYRLRFAVRGKIGSDVFTGAFAANGDKRTDKEFEWGIRLVAGTLANPASPNPVLTDFFSRKPIDLTRFTFRGDHARFRDCESSRANLNQPGHAAR